MIRLTDPTNCVNHETLNRLNDKLAKCMTRMFCKPENGGNPFLFVLTQSKTHELRTKLGAQEIKTAATDGKRFYWSPEFMEQLDTNELTTVMAHECWHVVFYHAERMRGMNATIANWTMDWVVNACIEHDHIGTRRPGKLWGGNLGEPLTFKAALDYIDGTFELGDTKWMFADYSVHGRSPENLYEEVMKHIEKSPRKCKSCGSLNLDPKTGVSKIPKPWAPGTCAGCGQDLAGSGVAYGDMPSSMDSHIDTDVTKEEVQMDMERAATAVKMMRGNVPSDIEDALKELYEPTLSMHDLIRSARFRKSQTDGMFNNWARIRRRPLAFKPRMYMPHRHGHSARWLCMLDTSGSMSHDDLVYGVSQLKVAGRDSKGYVVPVDAEPHWDAVTEIGDMSDLERVKVVGRGGTVFEQFFEEFPDRLGTDFDALIIITDGDCGHIPMHLMPPMDVVWVITNGRDFEPNFGFVAPLRLD